MKLTGKDESWWNLTAMPTHYESQCIPTPLAWFAYNYLPAPAHALSVVATYVIEILLPFFFLVPTQFLSKITFVGQVKLMVMIMLTGNYNFFNFLYILLCLSLTDDSWWLKARYWVTVDQATTLMTLGKLAKAVFHFLAVSGLVTSVVLLGFKGLSSLQNLEAGLNFTHEQFMAFVEGGATVGVYLGLANLAWVAWLGLHNIASISKGYLDWFVKIFFFFTYTTLALAMFGMSIPTFTHGVGIRGNPLNVPKVVTNLNLATSELHLIHSYGLFRYTATVYSRLAFAKSTVVQGP